MGSSDDFKLTKKDGTIADGTTVTLRIKSVANYNGKISLQSATFKSGDTVVGTATATGGQLAGDPIYTISNDLVPSADLTVENLLFYENHVPVDFDTLDPAVLVDSTGIPGTGAVLDGPGTLEEYSVSSIADGTFFISQGQIFNEGDNAPIGWFVDGYTTTVSEPSTLALLGISMLGIWLIRWQRIDWPRFSGGSRDASWLGAPRVGLVRSTSRQGHAKKGTPEISTSGLGRGSIPSPAE